MLTLSIFEYFVSVQFFFLHLLFCTVLFPSPLQPGDASVIINEKGCVQAGEEWLEQNLVLVAGVLVGIAFMQVDNRDDMNRSLPR